MNPLDLNEVSQRVSRLLKKVEEPDLRNVLTNISERLGETSEYGQYMNFEMLVNGVVDSGNIIHIFKMKARFGERFEIVEHFFKYLFLRNDQVGGESTQATLEKFSDLYLESV